MLQRIDDLTLMCEKRIATLKKLAQKPPRPIQTVQPVQNPDPQSIAPQPHGGAPNLLRHRKSAHRVSTIFDFCESVGGSLGGKFE